MNLWGFILRGIMGKKWYVYRHRRLDTNEIFYVGIGQTKGFKRAYSRFSRTTWWYNITNVTSYRVEIISKNLTSIEAYDLEILLIKTYGRRSKNKGTLVNISKGGDGIRNYKPSKKQRYNHSIRMKGCRNPNYGIKMTDEQKKLISKTKKERNVRTNCRLVLDNNTGIFYDCLKDAAFSLNLNYNILKSQFQRNVNKTQLNYC